MKRRTIAIVLSFTMSMLLIACGNTEETVETETAVETETETEAETYKTIGEETEEAFCVKLKNSTGLDIIGVSVKLTEDTEFDVNLLAEKDVFAAEEERNLFYEAVANENSDDTAEEDAKLMTQGYDIQLTFADESVQVLHAFPFEDIESGEIYLEDEVAYIKYISVSTGETVSTKEAEVATKQAEEAAQEEEYVEDYTYNNDVSWGNSSSNNGTSSGSTVVPEAPTQGSEECLGDDALTWGDDSSNSGTSSDSTVVPDAPAQGSEECLGDDALTW